VISFDVASICSRHRCVVALARSWKGKVKNRGTALGLCVISLVAFAGCATVEDEHGKVVTASADSLQECQGKLDELAGRHVQVQQVALSTTAYVCKGVIADAPMAASTPAQSR